MFGQKCDWELLAGGKQFDSENVSFFENIKNSFGSLPIRVKKSESSSISSILFNYVLLLMCFKFIALFHCLIKKWAAKKTTFLAKSRYWVVVFWSYFPQYVFRQKVPRWLFKPRWSDMCRCQWTWQDNPIHLWWSSSLFLWTWLFRQSMRHSRWACDSAHLKM